MSKVLLGSLVLLTAIILMAVRRPDLPPSRLVDTGYAPHDVAAPTLYGWSLILYGYLYQIPVLSHVVSAILYKTNHFASVHSLAYYSGVMPTYEPLKLLSDASLQKHVDYSHEHDYSQFLTSDSIRTQILGPPNTLNSPNTPNSPLTIESIHAAFVSKRTTPLALAKQVLENVDKLQHLNLFIQLHREDFLSQAKASTARWEAGEPLSILDGIPVAVKDETDVIGYNTTFGTKFVGSWRGPARKDAEIVARIRALGGMILGKTNMHEIGIQPNGYNSHFGAAKNPYSKRCEHDTGGSSSGSAAAVASGLVPIALGADGGGSIRLPSGLNGIVGLKATYARVPFLPVASCWSVVHTGVLASSLRDQMIAYMAVAGIGASGASGASQASETSVQVLDPPTHFHLVANNKDLKDLTIGVYWDWFSHAQPEVVDACWRVVEQLRDNYEIKVKNISIPHLNVLRNAHAITILSEWLTSDWKIVNHEYEDVNFRYSPASQAMLDFAKQFDAKDFVAAQQVRTVMLNYFENVIFNKEKENVDIVVTPTSSIVAHKYIEEAFETGLFDAELISKAVRFMALGNFIGIPGITMPVGYSNVDGSGNVLQDSRLPIGLQLMANHWNEHVLFRVSNAIESLVERELPPQENRAVYDL